MTRKEIDSLAEYVKTYRAKGLAWLTAEDTPRGSILKFLTPEQTQAIIDRAGAAAGDLLLIVADRRQGRL